jgi:DNA (cytosine-5)-methyltransferase 1
MKHASLFSGIGGFDLAAQWMGWENVFQVEIDKFCQKVLAKNFPNVTRYGDIKEFDGTKYRGAIDVLTGGFPCQPFSVAGKRNGKEDSRYLWPEMLRVIGEISPSFIVGENVSGSWQLVDEISSALAIKGYATEPIGIDAASIGAPQKRLRYWFLAYSNSDRLEAYSHQRQVFKKRDSEFCNSSSTNVPMWNEPAPNRTSFCGVRDGLPNRVHRIKSLGNAIVPQVAYEIFKAIECLEDDKKGKEE